MKQFFNWLFDYSTFFGITVLIMLITLALLFPFALIWAINTLFNAGIAYGFNEYLAVIVINVWTYSRFNKGE